MEKEMNNEEGKMNSENTNIVKKVCKELGLTYRELGEKIGYGEGAIRNSATKEVSEQMHKAIELYLETIELKKQLESTNFLKNALKDLINH